MLQVKKILYTLAVNIMLMSVLGQFTNLYAREGVWIPATLKDHEKDMKLAGLDIPVDRLYNSDGSGLNNAVVLFGRGCTAEIISSKGLILTNHHCGYGSVQRLSSPEYDYFATGFWAQDRNGELPCPGLTVTFFRRMENVSDRVLIGIDDTLPDHIRESMITLNIAIVELEFQKATGLDATIRPMYDGNQYWVFITQTYKDIRLVGFPPNGIGQFGGDDENWVWPRHTGDFSIFRIYADSANMPADYSKTNKPYQTENFFTINAGGYKEGDFTMVYGFPGTTMEYISSYELKQTYSIIDPINIQASTLRLKVWKKHMDASRDVFLQYTSKYSGVANGWKKWQGEIEGLKACKVMETKQDFETDFQAWEDTDKKAPEYAADLLDQLYTVTQAADTPLYIEQYIKETILGIELIQTGASMEKLLSYFRMQLPDNALRDSLKLAAAPFAGFFKNFNPATDRDIFIQLMPLYFKNCAHWLPEYYKTQFAKHNKNFSIWAADVYKTSLLASDKTMKDWITTATSADSPKIINDPAWQFFSAINTLRKTYTLPKLTTFYKQKHYLNRLYMKAQMEMQQEKTFYPDANLTLRLAYGKIQGLKNGTPPSYKFQTKLDEIIALNNPKKGWFTVPPKLIDLYKNKNYGRWAENGSMPVAFIATNHTSGGNSGSPTLNSKGQLIGTNFDRAYEGTMSDYYFSETRCRNISVDIRYTLFIIEKFGGAGWLLDEMNIVQ